MSGIHQLLMAGSPYKLIGTVHVGFVSGFVGLVTDLGGSGSTFTAIQNNMVGIGVRRITSLNDSFDLQIVLVATLAQSFFRAINIWDKNNVRQQYLTSGATFSSGGGTSQWLWGTGAAGTVVWEGATIGLDRRIELLV